MEIKEIEFENKMYPQKLREIKNPPKKLYLLGDEKLLNTESLSIIGARKCTKYGANLAFKFARELSLNGVVIVSGMAEGIDSQAHLGAIDAKGKTIAVLGSGFNHIFPNKIVFNKILENGGAIITEYEKNVDVFPQGFRDRNRIVAGLSIGTFIIEAKEFSGTGITANYAKKFKRDVFCIPHRIEEPNGVGTNRLLKNGAKLVTEIDDILKYFKKIKKIEKIDTELQIEIPNEYKKVYEQIENNLLSADEISKKISTNISEINTILTMLELEGYIESMPGGYYKRKEL